MTVLLQGEPLTLAELRGLVDKIRHSSHSGGTKGHLGSMGVDITSVPKSNGAMINFGLTGDNRQPRGWSCPFDKAKGTRLNDNCVLLESEYEPPLRLYI